jgi:DNA-directed RNA polymerase subunit RPC12/RpoP
MQIECPKCGSPDKRPSISAGFLDRFWRVIGYVPYRCRSCRTRFFRRRRDYSARTSPSTDSWTASIDR